MTKTDFKDGGWGWIIVLASFATQFIAEGVTYTFGVFLVEISEEFKDVSKSRVSWIPSVMTGTYHAVGPIGSVLVNRFGLLPVSFLGCGLAACGYASSYFIKGVIPLYFTIGMLSGIGLSFLYLPSMVSVAQWFDKRRALAIGLSVSGAGFGTIFFEWVTVLAINKEGWRIALLVTAGMIVCSIPFSLMFRPFEPSSVSDCNPTIILENAANPKQLQMDNAQSSNKLLKWLRGFINVDLLHNPLFILFAMCDLLLGIGYNIPYLYLPDIEQNETGITSSTLLGIIGGFNIIGRIIMGYFSDKIWVNRQFMYLFVLAISAAATISCPHLPTLLWLRMYAGVYGTCIGAYMTLKSVILVDLFGLDQLTDAYGFLLLFQAVGFLIGPPIVGALFDSFGNYNAGFYFAGISLGLSACLSFFIPILKQLIDKKENNLVQKSLNVSCGVDNLGAVTLSYSVDNYLE